MNSVPFFFSAAAAGLGLASIIVTLVGMRDAAFVLFALAISSLIVARLAEREEDA